MCVGGVINFAVLELFGLFFDVEARRQSSCDKPERGVASWLHSSPRLGGIEHYHVVSDDGGDARCPRASVELESSSTSWRVRNGRERPSLQSLLCRAGIRGHRSEIMFGVLVVILGPDRIATLGFSLGQRQIPFIVSLCVLRALRLGAGGIRCPSF